MQVPICRFCFNHELSYFKLYVFFSGAYKVGHSEDNHYLWAFFNHSTLNNYPKNDILTSNRFRALFTNFAKFL